MTLEEDLPTLMESDAGITGLVGTRIHWNEVPQGSDNPVIVLRKVDGSEGYTLAGRDGLFVGRIQVDIRSLQFTEAIYIKRTVLDRLSGFAGIVGTTRFDGIFQLSERYHTEKPDLEVFHVVQLDFEIWASMIEGDT